MKRLSVLVGFLVAVGLCGYAFSPARPGPFRLRDAVSAPLAGEATLPKAAEAPAPAAKEPTAREAALPKVPEAPAPAAKEPAAREAALPKAPAPADPAPAPKPLAEKNPPILEEALTRPDLRPLPEPVTEPLPEPCPACGSAQERTRIDSPWTLSGEEKCGHYHLGNDLIFQRQVQWEQRCPFCEAASSQTETQEERFCYGGNDADALRQRIDSLPPLNLPTV